MNWLAIVSLWLFGTALFFHRSMITSTDEIIQIVEEEKELAWKVVAIIMSVVVLFVIAMFWPLIIVGKWVLKAILKVAAFYLDGAKGAA